MKANSLIGNTFFDLQEIYKIFILKIYLLKMIKIKWIKILDLFILF